MLHRPFAPFRLPSPCSPSRPSRYAGASRALTAPRADGHWFSSRVADEKRPKGRFRSPTRLDNPLAAPTRRSHPKGRSEAEERRSRLTATGRRGRWGLGIYFLLNDRLQGKFSIFGFSRDPHCPSAGRRIEISISDTVFVRHFVSLRCYPSRPW